MSLLRRRLCLGDPPHNFRNIPPFGDRFASGSEGNANPFSALNYSSEIDIFPTPLSSCMLYTLNIIMASNLPGVGVCNLKGTCMSRLLRLFGSVSVYLARHRILRKNNICYILLLNYYSSTLGESFPIVVYAYLPERSACDWKCSLFCFFSFFVCVVFPGVKASCPLVSWCHSNTHQHASLV